METAAQLVSIANAEVEESRKTLERLKGDVDALSDVVLPVLLKHAQEIRSARMTVVSEVNTALTAMRDVRRFFLDAAYNEEMTRLERFVSVCKDIQQLKADGVFDAVCDSAIRLAIKETQ